MLGKPQKIGRFLRNGISFSKFKKQDIITKEKDKEEDINKSSNDDINFSLNKPTNEEKNKDY